MPEVIPFKPGISDQILEVTLMGITNLVRARWNTRDAAWYIDVLETDEQPVMMGMKAVLGVKLGRTSTHPFFVGRALLIVDLSNEGVEATLDDFGTRVVAMYVNEADLELMRQVPFVMPRPNDL